MIIDDSSDIDRPDSHLTLYAHRGSMALAPENTMMAFHKALEFGADVMEIDVRLSRDGHVMVIHDERVERTCDGHGAVRDMNLSQLKKLDAAFHFMDLDGRPYRNEGITVPTLAEMFERLPHTPINIDIKDNTRQAALAVAEVIEEHNRQCNVNIGSFHAQALMHFRSALPTVTTAASQAEVAQLYFKRQLYQTPPFHYLQIPLRYMGIPLATRSFIQHATQRNIKTVFWTINERRSMQRLVDLKVSGFVTDRVDIAGPLLGKQPAGSRDRG